MRDRTHRLAHGAGPGNRLLFDGTYRYAYDAEGNRTAKFKDTNAGGTLSIGDTAITLYGYDQRNRLVSVSHVSAWAAAQAGSQAAFNSSGTALPGSDLELRYTYDYADRRIRRSIDADGAAGSGQQSVSFAAYAGGERPLEISRPNDRIVTESATGKVLGFLGQVVQRNFYGNGEDEILAVDKLTWTGTIVLPTSTTSTFWTFTDHQNSVRDIVSGTSPTLGKVVEHRQYDSFGRLVRQTTEPQAGVATTPGVGIDFGYAGRPLEARTGLSDNRARWYEPGTGKFINEDPSGFKGGDANLFRYVGNDPLNQVDPSGLTGKYAQSAGRSGVSAAGFGAYGAGGLMTSGGNSIVMGPGGTTSAVSRSPSVPSSYQRPYRTEVETIGTFTASPQAPFGGGSFVSTGILAPLVVDGRTRYGQDGNPIIAPVKVYTASRSRDADAWVDRAGGTWNTDAGEISAFGAPPRYTPSWTAVASAGLSVVAAIASSRGTQSILNAPPRGVTNLQRVSASQANAPFLKRNWNAPYAEGEQARAFTTGRDMRFVRVHGAINQLGQFMARAKEIAGMSPQQIQQHLAMPTVPTHISDVFVGSGVRMQMGRIAPQPSYGVNATRGVQYQLIDQIPSSAFQNMRPLP